MELVKITFIDEQGNEIEDIFGRTFQIKQWGYDKKYGGSFVKLAIVKECQ